MLLPMLLLVLPARATTCDLPMLARVAASITFDPADDNLPLAAQGLAAICPVPASQKSEIGYIGSIAPEDFSKTVFLTVAKEPASWNAACPAGGMAILDSVGGLAPLDRADALVTACKPDFIEAADKGKLKETVAFAILLRPWLEGGDKATRDLVLRAMSGV